MKINEPMRQFLIDRTQTLYYEARQFPKTRRVAENWICRALRLARRAGDMELYRQIAHKDALYGTKMKKMTYLAKGRKTGLRMDSRAFLNAARAVLMDSRWIARGRISNDALFTAIEARLGIEKLPRRAWAKHLSSLGLKPARWNKGKIRGWHLPDVTPEPDVTPKI